MTARRQCATLLFAAVGLLPIACLAGDDQPPPMTVDPFVARVVDALAPTPQTWALQRSEFKSTLLPSGTSTSASATYESIGRNVWGVTHLQRTGNGLIESRSVSLCGLIELLSASRSVLEFENDIPVPIGRQFVQMGMHVTKSLTSRSRTTSLTIPEDSNNICAPSPGVAFSYSTKTEVELTHMSAASRADSKTLTSALTWKCVAGAIKPSSELGPAWTGDYVPVTCTGTNSATEKTSTSKYAYLVGSGLYLKLETMSDAFQSRNAYTAFERSSR